MLGLKKEKNNAEAAKKLDEAGFGRPRKAKNRKEKKQEDVWKYRVKWGAEIQDKSFNNVLELVNYIESQNDYVLAHNTEDTVVTYKINQDEHIEYAMEVALPLTKPVDEIFVNFDSKERKPFANSLVTKGPAAKQQADRLAEEKEDVVDEYDQQQNEFGEAALARVQEKNQLSPSNDPEETPKSWGMVEEPYETKRTPSVDPEEQVSKPYPPASNDMVEQENISQQEEKPEVEEDQKVIISTPTQTTEAPQAVTPEDSVLASLIKAQFQLSKELDIDREAILKSDLERQATADLKKAQAEAAVSSKIELEKAKRAESRRHEEAMKAIETKSEEDWENTKQALSSSFAEEASENFEEQRVAIKEKQAALRERKEELDNQIQAFRELLG